MKEKIDAKYIYFFHNTEDDKPKTQVWYVFSKNDNEWLGQISYWGRWHGYVFASTFKKDGTAYGRFISDIIFEHRCLHDIANFIEQLNKKQRGGNKNE